MWVFIVGEERSERKYWRKEVRRVRVMGGRRGGGGRGLVGDLERDFERDLDLDLELVVGKGAGALASDVAVAVAVVADCLG